MEIGQPGRGRPPASSGTSYEFDQFTSAKNNAVGLNMTGEPDTFSHIQAGTSLDLGRYPPFRRSAIPEGRHSGVLLL